MTTRVSARTISAYLNFRMVPTVTHDLKTWPGPFTATWRGAKTFEWRRDDRGFRIGDDLRLREWQPRTKTYTGRLLLVRVLYILRGRKFGVPAGYCIMSFVVKSRAASQPRSEAA